MDLLMDLTYQTPSTVNFLSPNQTSQQSCNISHDMIPQQSTFGKPAKLSRYSELYKVDFPLHHIPRKQPMKQTVYFEENKNQKSKSNFYRLPRFRESYTINRVSHAEGDNTTDNTRRQRSTSTGSTQQQSEHNQQIQQRFSSIAKIIGNTEIAKRFKIATAGTPTENTGGGTTETASTSEKLSTEEQETVIFKSKYRPQTKRFQAYNAANL